MHVALLQSSDAPQYRSLMLEAYELAVRLYRSVGFEAFGTEPMAILTPGGFRAKVHMQRVIGRGSVTGRGDR